MITDYNPIVGLREDFKLDPYYENLPPPDSHIEFVPFVGRVVKKIEEKDE